MAIQLLQTTVITNEKYINKGLMLSSLICWVTKNIKLRDRKKEINTEQLTRKTRLNYLVRVIKQI